MSTPKNIEQMLDLSDDEFEKISGPPVEAQAAPASETPAPAPEEKPEETPEPETEEDQGQKPEETETPESESQKQGQEKQGEEEEEQEAPKPEEDPAKKDAFAGEGKEPDSKAQGQQDEKPKAEEKAESEKKEPKAGSISEQDAQIYKAFYEKIMTPFKANGTMIQLQSADEAIRLMQMGANYTKKMQQLQPNKKLLMMLENNGLLDEGKLSFLIDLDKKDPEAIKKLLKDSNFDPIETDISKVNYRGGSHAVSDQEAALNSAIEDLNFQEGGKETLQSIHSTWDQASKKLLMENPELLGIFHAQRMHGIYDQIVTEVNRRRILDQIPASASFLQAYKLVGDDLQARGLLQPKPISSAPAPKPPVGGAPVAVRPARTPTPKASDTRVRAAAPTRTTPKAAQAPTNYLAMSDDDFLKLPPPGSS